MTDENNIYDNANTEAKSEKISSFDGSNEGGEVYNASREGTCTMLKIRLSSGEGKFITYNLIQEMDYVMDNILSINTPNCIIEIQGKQLQILANRIARHEVEWIQERKSNSEGVRIDEIKIHTSADTLKAET